MKKLFLLLTTILCIGISCSSDDDANHTPCTEVYTPGLKVTVKDGGITLTQGITVTATEGDYIEVLENFEGETDYQGAFERPGTYTVTVTGEGYMPYISEDITVTADECHVITQEITVNLQPQ